MPSYNLVPSRGHYLKLLCDVCKWVAHEDLFPKVSPTMAHQKVARKEAKVADLSRAYTIAASILFSTIPI